VGALPALRPLARPALGAAVAAGLGLAAGGGASLAAAAVALAAYAGLALALDRALVRDLRELARLAPGAGREMRYTEAGDGRREGRAQAEGRTR
jgi:hypothetical protein